MPFIVGGLLRIGKSNGAPPSPAPSVAAVQPQAFPTYAGGTGLQDPTGGTGIVIYGASFVSGCSVTFEQAGIVIGTSPAVTFFDAATLVATTPALPVGTYDVIVTNPDLQNSGATGNGLHVSWHPSVLSPTGLWMPGGYSVTGTQGVDAVGTWIDSSGNGRDLVSNSSAAPGYAPEAAAGGWPEFRGDTAVGRFLDGGANFYYLSGPVYHPDYLTTFEAGTLVTFVRPRARPIDATDYFNASFVAGAAATPNLQISSKGFKAVGYTDATALYETVRAGRGRTGAVSMAAVSWDVDNLYVTVNEHAPIATPIGGIGLSGSNMQWLEVGRSYAGSQYADGDVLLICAVNGTLTAAEFATFHAWAAVYGLVPASYFVPTTETYHWIRSDAGVTLAGSKVTALADQSGTGDPAKDLTGGYTDADFTPSDPNFAGKPSYGTLGADVSGAWYTSGSFASPIDGARTAYDVFRAGSGGSANFYARINSGGSGVGCALYGVPIASSYSVTTGTASIALVVPPDVPGVAVTVYNGASSEALWNRWNTPDVTGDTGSGLVADGLGYSNVGMGTFPGEPSAYDRTEFIVCEGAHDAATRAQWVGYLCEKYELALSAA